MKKYFIWILLLVWVLVACINAAFTQLYNDEAYYWVYSQYLQWGYFDHPPFIALMIKAGDFLFHNELGVRLFSIVLIATSIYLIFKLSKTENNKLFALVIFSMLPFHLFGFTSMPDTPLIFFTALFFFVYNKYLEDDSLKITLSLGVIMAAMLYSKYHGVLVILFSLASNPALLKKKSFWIASIFGALLFTPHLYWQFVHDFPSVKYHFIDRSAKAYRFVFTSEYVGGQLIFYGPLTGLFLYWALFKIKTTDLLEKALKYTVVGTLIFFLLSTFKGRVEVNWTIAILAPITILGLRYYQAQTTSLKWIYIAAWISIPIILLVRIHTMVPLAQFKKDRTNDFRGHREYAEEVVKASKGLPIVADRYQSASSLAFYTGQQVPVFNMNARFSQYDLWEFDTVLVGKKVALFNGWLTNDITLSDGSGIKFVDEFPIYKFIDIRLDTEKSPKVTIEWNKPLSFYTFTRKHPVVINVKVKHSGEEQLLVDQRWTVNPTSAKQQIDFEIPQRDDREYEIELALETPEFGIIRQYPVHKLNSK